jgi:predicted oxidoreductase
MHKLHRLHKRNKRNKLKLNYNCIIYNNCNKIKIINVKVYIIVYLHIIQSLNQINQNHSYTVIAHLLKIYILNCVQTKFEPS